MKKHPWDCWSAELRANLADYEKRDRVHKAELAGRASFDEPRPQRGVGIAIDVARIPLFSEIPISHNHSHTRTTTMSDALTIAANLGVRAGELATMAAQTKEGKPLSPNSYLSAEAPIRPRAIWSTKPEIISPE